MLKKTEQKKRITFTDTFFDISVLIFVTIAIDPSLEVDDSLPLVDRIVLCSTDKRYVSLGTTSSTFFGGGVFFWHSIQSLRSVEGISA